MFEQFDKVVSGEKTAVSLASNLLAEPYLTVIQSEQQRMIGSAASVLPALEIDIDDAPAYGTACDPCWGNTYGCSSY